MSKNATSGVAKTTQKILSRVEEGAIKRKDYLTPQRELREHYYKLLHEGDPRSFGERL